MAAASAAKTMAIHRVRRGVGVAAKPGCHLADGGDSEDGELRTGVHDCRLAVRLYALKDAPDLPRGTTEVALGFGAAPPCIDADGQVTRVDSAVMGQPRQSR